MNKTCPRCKKTFTMGVNGTVYGCDKCTGIQRDINGEWWKPNQKRQWRMNFETSKTFYLFRKDVFKNQNKTKGK